MAELEGNLAKASKATRVSWAYQESQFRMILKQASSNISRTLIRAGTYRNEFGELPKGQIRDLEKLVDTVVQKTIGQLELQLDKNLLAVVNRQLTTQSLFLKEQGDPGISRVKKQEIALSVARNVKNIPFPGTDKSTKQRLGALGARMAQILKQTIRVPEHERIEAWERARKRLFEHDKSAQVSGGVMSRQLARINRTEQARAAQRASVEIAKERGIELVYWRRSPGAPACHVCDILANSTGAGVRAIVSRSGIIVPSYAGLYTVDDLPLIPHPHCMCGQEMLL